MLNISSGTSYPLGSTFDGKGTNFALFSEHATGVELCLFNEKGTKELEKISMTENDNGIWHIYLEGIKPGQIYGYRVDGPYDPLKGKRFNKNKLLIDPYAKKLTGQLIWNKAIFGYDVDSTEKDLSFSTLDSAPFVPKSVVTANISHFINDTNPQTPFEKTLIYELHTKGFTALFPKVPDVDKGTFRALCHKSVQTYLKWLDITAVELMPVHAFFGHQKGRGRTNYWGYETLSYFALENTYGSSDDFKNMVQVMHQNGLEVILDVVYNHTIEGNHLGPTLCYRGIDNETYYTLDKENKRFYYDSTGCGASFNTQNPYVLMLVMDSLRYFVNVMGVDGFRFDLAATLGREKTEFQYSSAFFKTLMQDESLKRCKFIAEPWDIGQRGYQIGAFPPSMAEWNDRFRDVTRRFWLGHERQGGGLASRISGSSDIFGYRHRGMYSSINFVTSHDGFCLRDLVSFEKKHNEANNENNMDGNNNNWSSNLGVEGLIASDDIKAKRLRRAKNLMATLLFSFGTPMISAGDEFLTTHFGNNNPYNQDNIISYLVWDAIEKEGYEFIRFFKKLVGLRHHLGVFSYKHFFKGVPVSKSLPKDLAWYTPKGKEFQQQDWSNQKLKTLSYAVLNGDHILFVIFNADVEPVLWTFPNFKEMKTWKLILDTSEKFQIAENNSGQSLEIPAECVLAFQIGR